MNISQDTVVSFHYILTNENGDELETSAKDQPMVYLHGHNGLMPALEKALEGKAVGDKPSITLAPADAYGEIRKDSEQRIPIKHLSGAKKWKPGMVATVHTEQGQHQVTVLKVGHTMATVDTNHPFAGVTLTFNVEICEIRAASEEEITHKHAHGPGGHQH